MRKLSIGQKKALAEFFANAAVAWFSAGMVIPFFANKTLAEFVTFGLWGVVFSAFFLTIALIFTKGVAS